MAKKSTKQSAISTHITHPISGFRHGKSRDMAKGPRKHMAKDEISNQCDRPPKR
jgi:hypothetical protein